MTVQSNDTLQRAIDDRKSSAGSRTTWVTAEHYAWWNPTLLRWCLMTKDCLEGPDVVMPSWWSPEQRFAVRNRDGSLKESLRLDGSPATFATMEYAHRSTTYGDRAHIVTASLETGEEIPA